MYPILLKITSNPKLLARNDQSILHYLFSKLNLKFDSVEVKNDPKLEKESSV